MQIFFRKTLSLILLFHSLLSFSQYSVKGRIVDAKNQQPLAFVNIIFNSDPHTGTNTDINGKFFFSSKNALINLTCSYIGYKNLTLQIDSVDKNNLVIKLQSTDIPLQEVIIKAGENPAHRIIRKVIENRNQNDPNNVESFKYTCYNKTVFDIFPKDSAVKDKDWLEIDSVLKGGHFMIMESVTNRKYISPDLSEEIVSGVKVSGFPHPSFAPLATDLQPFSFYKEVIQILDINYLNPISRGSLSKYFFNIEDTLYNNRDTVFVISFKPYPGKNFDGLKGLLYINTNLFAVQNVIAEPFEKGFIDIRIQQLYSFVDTKQWFPKQLNFELRILKYPQPNLNAFMNGRSYIDSVRLNPPLVRKEFSQAAVRISDEASTKDETFWSSHRAEHLDKRDTTTYRVIDSVGRVKNFDLMLHIVEKVVYGKIPVKCFDIDLSQTFIYNKYEGQRLSLGLYTNEHLFKNFSIGGFFGYGLKDKQYKYGGDFTLKLNKDREIEFKGGYQNTLQETRKNGLDLYNMSSYSLRSYIGYQFDRVEKKSASLSFRALRFAKVNISADYRTVLPKYGYEFHPAEDIAVTGYTNAEARFAFRYAYRERVVESFNQRVSIDASWPVFYFVYARGMKDIYNSAFDYNKIEARIEQSFFTKNLGQTNFRLEGGYIDKALPYGLLFTGEGSYDKNIPYVLKNYFQTMGPYEFLSDRYVNLFFSHNFRSLLFKTKEFKPIISIHCNIGWGTLSDKDKHQLITFNTKEKGYYESGVVVDNIVRYNYFNVAYVSLGGGVFYRYGPYAYLNQKDNFVYKLSVIFTTK